MSNSLYEQYGQQQILYSSNPMLQRFMQFRNDFFRNNFSRDPRQTVQNLISSGQMSQSQFNILGQQATQLQKMLNL